MIKGHETFTFSSQACKKPNATDKAFCESVDSTHRRNDFFLEPRAVGRRELHISEAFVVRAAPRAFAFSSLSLTVVRSPRAPIGTRRRAARRRVLLQIQTARLPATRTRTAATFLIWQVRHFAGDVCYISAAAQAKALGGALGSARRGSVRHAEA